MSINEDADRYQPPLNKVLERGSAIETSMSGLRLSLGVISLILGVARAQDAGCDFTINAQPGSVYPVDSPGYSGSYPRGATCRWCATCPTGYYCRLDCPDISMPQSTSCSVDRLLISRSGDPSLYGANYYCGSGSLSDVRSVNQKICVGLVTSTNSPGGRFSCDVYAQPSCICGYKKTNRIVGGEPTQVNEYPMMAGIIYQEVAAIKCGATIISNQYLVTAAHCLRGRTPASTGVIVGEHDTTTGGETTATQGFRVESFTLHPQYSETNQVNDIATMKVVGTIPFSESVGPVCLPYKYTSTSFAGVDLVLLGWGTTSIGGPTSRVLRKVTVQGISVAQCQASVSSVTGKQLCTYTPGKDACQDDSGGPALYTEPNTGRQYLAGVISYGKSCASNSPGINTRVSAYLDFIQSSTSATYCNI